MGLIRLLAGALLVLWLLRLVRRALFGASRRSRARGPQDAPPRERRAEFDGEGIEEADYEELP